MCCPDVYKKGKCSNPNSCPCHYKKEVVEKKNASAKKKKEEQKDGSGWLLPLLELTAAGGAVHADALGTATESVRISDLYRAMECDKNDISAREGLCPACVCVAVLPPCAL